jgi:hypothetical protein
MASLHLNAPVQSSQDNVDLLRRYAPSLTIHTHAQVAAHIPQDTQGCWPWDGRLTGQGYGAVCCELTPYGYQRSVPAHRYMYDTLVGPIPDDYHVHHRCLHKPCWNLFHLEAVSPKEHKARHRPTPTPWAPPVQLTLPWCWPA